MSKDKSTEGIELKSHFNRAFDMDSFAKHFEDDIIWQAMGDNPGLIIPTSHYAHSVMENKIAQKADKDQHELLMFIISSQQINKRILEQLGKVKQNIDRLYFLGGAILDQITEVQNQVDNIETDHEVADRLLLSEYLKGKDIDKIDNQHIKDIYARYKDRGKDRGKDINKPLEDIIAQQVQFERIVYIPWLTYKRSQLGNLYNQTIDYAQKLDKQVTQLESEHKALMDMPDSEEKVSELNDLENSLKELNDESVTKYEDLKNRKEQLEQQVNEGMKNSERPTETEKELTKLSPNLDTFGLSL